MVKANNKNTKRCAICDYCGIDDRFDHGHLRTFFLDRKTDRYICGDCADSIGDALAEFTQEEQPHE